MLNFKYRKDIQGLRGFSVLVVLLYHLNIPFLTGGFIGVDIFFVISGYVITGTLINEFQKFGRIDLINFYARRIRRLAPALFVTLFFSSLFAVFLFTPNALINYGNSLIATVLEVSNFYFLTQTDYFDINTNFRVLLHTWSLGVETQFYLILPMLFIAISKLSFKTKFISLLCLITLSIFLNLINLNGIIFGIDQKSVSFYLLPFRLYELMAGVLLAVVNFDINHSKSNIYKLLFFYIGLLLILYSIFRLDDSTQSFYLLIPVTGSFLIILSDINPFIFTNKLLVFLGDISYPLYLLHWPIIIFFRYLTFDEITILQDFLILALSILLSTLLYKYVELPLRNKSNI